MIINFWATWCQPCLKEIPALKQIASESNARVVGIALDEGGANPVRQFVDRNHINYKVLLGNEKVFRRFEGFAIPHTVVLDRDHKVVNIHRGPATFEEFQRDLKDL